MSKIPEKLQCPVCKNNMIFCFNETILNKYKVDFFNCIFCGLIKTEEPFWFEEAYKDAISALDTGIISRNQNMANKLSVLLYAMFGGKGRYIDFAGGYGILSRIMRDFGFDYYWHDQYCENIFMKGFEFSHSKRRHNAVTAFEVLEHITHPIQFIDLSLESANTDTFIFSTVLYKGDIPDPKAWWYYTFATGQHITFYKYKTLKIIANKLKLNLYSRNNLHMMTKAKFNPSLFKIISCSFSTMLSYLVRLKMNSKMMEDHILLKVDLESESHKS